MIIKRNISFIIINTIILTGLVLSILIPFLHIVAVSLSQNVAILRGEVGIVPRGFNIEMYKMVFEDDRILNSYKNTIIYTVLGTSISLVATAMGSYALSKKHIFGYKTFSIMIMITMFFGGGMIPTYLVVRNLSILDTIWAIVLPSAVTTWNFIIMRSFFSVFPKDIEEAGSIDGLSEIGIFFRLVLPSSNAILATIGLYYAVSIWNSYFIPFLYLTTEAMYPLQLILKEILTIGSSTTAGIGDIMVVEDSLKYATIVVAIAPIMMVYPFIQKYFAKGALVGSIKG